MSDKVIVYKRPDGGLSILHPTAEGLAAAGSIESLAARDVPTGLAYGIIDRADLPTDRTFRAAWTVDDDVLVDGIGNTSNTFEA